MADGITNVLIKGLPYFKFLAVKQNFIPDGWQMVFANVLIEGWTTDP